MVVGDAVRTIELEPAQSPHPDMVSTAAMVTARTVKALNAINSSRLLRGHFITP
jgi:hypothetical protein